MGAIGVPSEKIVGYRVMFRMGKFKMYLYMKREYYEVWKHARDPQIKQVVVEEVEMESTRFLG